MVTYIFREEVSQNEIIKQARVCINQSENLSAIKNNGHVLHPRENASITFKEKISFIKRILEDLQKSLNKVKNIELGRNFLRRLGNTPSGILKSLSDEEKKKTIIKVFGVDFVEGLKKVSIFIEDAENTNTLRLKYGEGYKNFTKEVKEIKEQYDSFLHQRLCSVKTKINYFNY